MASGPTTLTYPGGVYAEPSGLPPLQIEQTYETPNGYRDFPFIYVHDCSALTNGLDYRGRRASMDGTADFILRAVLNTATVLAAATNTYPGVNPPHIGPVGGKFWLKNAWGSYCSSAPMIVFGGFAAGLHGCIAPLIIYGANGGQIAASLPSTSATVGSTAPSVWPIVPEKRYPYDGQIGFDLLNVNLSTVFNPNSIYHSILFLGVKRRRAANYCAYETPYRYKELPYGYVQELPLVGAAATVVGPPTTYTIEITDYDFEFQRILWTPTSALNGAVGSGPANASAGFGITMYDASGEPLSSAPVWIGSIADNAPLTPGFFAGAGPGGMVFPCPPLVYPQGSRLRFDIWQFGNSTTASDELVFQGVQRLPCT